MDATNSSGDDSSLSCDVDVDGDDGPHFNQSLLKLNIFQQHQKLAAHHHAAAAAAAAAAVSGAQAGPVRHFPAELLGHSQAAGGAAGAKANHSFSIESLLSSNCR